MIVSHMPLPSGRLRSGAHAALLAREGGHYRRLFERQAGAIGREAEPAIG